LDKEIVLAGYVGLGGSLKIAKEKEEELGQYFSKHFMNQIKKCEKYLIDSTLAFEGQNLAIREAMLPMKEDALQKGSDKESIVISLGESCSCDSLWSGLWNLCESWEVGVEVEFSRIPIRQETIEICQFVRLNPYQLSSRGSYLMITSQWEKVMLELRKKRVVSEVIGKTTKNKARLIKRGDYIRHLPRPKAT